jgi:hypothetical protein
MSETEIDVMTDDYVSYIYNKSCSIVQEMVPMALESSAISEEDIALFNHNRENNMIYAEVNYPCEYNWEELSQMFDDEEFKANSVEVLIKYANSETPTEVSDSDMVFAALLFTYEDLDNGTVLTEENADSFVDANIAWLPSL